MSENVLDIENLPMKSYFCDQSILVSSDVEHDTLADEISVRVHSANLRQISPSRLLRNPIPVIERFSSGLLLFHELTDRAVTYYSHRLMFT